MGTSVQECARWASQAADPDLVDALVCGRCGSDRIGDGSDGHLCCVDCGEQALFTELGSSAERGAGVVDVAT